MTDKYPPPITGAEPGSWANRTVLERWPEITRRMISENEFDPETVQRLTALVEEIREGRIRHLQADSGPDLAAWRSYINPQLGKRWLEIPWFFGEHYFYRRVLEAVDYFQTGQDPFRYQKEQGLISSADEIQAYVLFLDDRLGKRSEESLQEALYSSLWGNQADLSIWPAGAGSDPRHDTQLELREHLLADDSRQVRAVLKKGTGPERRLDMMLDNAGFELVCDLGLADLLLQQGLAGQVVLHVKAHPTFVSDAIPDDIEHTVAFLKAAAAERVAGFGERLESFLDQERLLVREDFFWNSPLAMWQLPSRLRQFLAGSSLLISKGDANYRRLLGDREWDLTLPFPQVVDYLPVPLLALRTLKAELAVGLDLDQVQEVYNRDREWMVNGRWGLIQFAGKGSR